MDSKALFSEKVERYRNSRPKYACGLMNYMKETFDINETTTIADIGAGTGIFTELLLDLGAKVIAVEPNAAMVEQLRLALYCKELEIHERPAESTEIESNTVDIITAAQSFHWFDKALFKAECKRLLNGNGPVCLIWNTRVVDEPINVKTAEIYTAFCPDFKGSVSFAGGANHSEEDIAEFFEGEFEKKVYEFPLTYDKQGFVDRALSASYALVEGDKHFETMTKAFEALFDRYAEDGKVVVPNKSVLYYGNI
ncbi:methyltransferase domain-containing protein [Macrococcus capreoli]|uniref:class I SAM-dependent methyltransferase n=1 Tax=Macrococcus capreoli TaxID=2982690 RepID=UPI0021D580B4|nr:class I SAM-dependent methyltransferase [Macrococcus sp. TMW 2.2395]MCU7557730.1 methyltransferase domain-containing protein [Macrococcus sp. TMW 2.2395]